MVIPCPTGIVLVIAAIIYTAVGVMAVTFRPGERLTILGLSGQLPGVVKITPWIGSIHPVVLPLTATYGPLQLIAGLVLPVPEDQAVLLAGNWKFALTVLLVAISPDLHVITLAVPL